MMHTNCSASHFFQSCFNLCFSCLRFCFLQIKKTRISLFEYFCKTFENVPHFRNRFVSNEQQIALGEKSVMGNLKFWHRKSGILKSTKDLFPFRNAKHVPVSIF